MPHHRKSHFESTKFIDMPCDEYNRLESERKRASERYAQFAYEKYRSLRGTSNTEAKRIAKDEQRKMNALAGLLSRHMQTCETRKREEIKQ
jgi:hypothetical protein